MVEVTIGRQGDVIILQVRDDGRGFAQAQPRKPNSFGLLGMRERAYLLDGEVLIDSTPGAGTCVSVRIPMDGERAPAADAAAATADGERA
jgi:signal transduction histidine kinase